MPITSFDPAVHVDHDFPRFIGDGQRFLYQSAGRTLAENEIWAASLDRSVAPVLVARA